MTVGELTEKCSTVELAHWQAIARNENTERKKDELRRRTAEGVNLMKQRLNNG